MVNEMKMKNVFHANNFIVHLKKTVVDAKAERSPLYFVLISGLSFGLFLIMLATKFNIYKLTLISIFGIFIACVLFYLVFWILYSATVSYFLKLEGKNILMRDSISYLPSLFFIFYPLSFYLPVAQFYAGVTESQAFTIVLAFSFIFIVLAGIIFLKVLLGGLLIDKFKENFELKGKLIYLLIIISFLVFASLAYLKHESLHSTGDLAAFTQIMWNTIHGKLFLFTVENGTEVNYMGNHMSPILILFAPVFAIFPDPLTLLFLQSFFICLGALPIYWLAKDRLNSTFAGLTFAVSYLLHPAINYQNLSDFHLDPVAMTFLIFTFYYLQRNNYKRFLVFLALALVSKENVPLIGAMFGFYIFFKHKNKLLGSLVALSSISFFILSIGILIPHFGVGHYIYIDRYSYLGSNFYEIIQTTLFQPMLVVRNVFTLQKLVYFVTIFLPTMFLSLLSPSSLLIALPVFAQNLLSDYYPQYSILYQYTATIIPFTYISAIYALEKIAYQDMKIKKSIGNLLNKLLGKGGDIRTGTLIISFCTLILMTCLFSTILYGPPPQGIIYHFGSEPTEYNQYFDKDLFHITDRDHLARNMMQAFPRDASVAAGPSIAYIPTREKLYFLFNASFIEQNKIEYVFVDLHSPLLSPEGREVVKYLLKSGNYTTMKNESGFIIFQRINDL